MRRTVACHYTESYLPTPRHRKLRYREAQRPVEVEVREVTAEEAPVAFVVKTALETKVLRLYDGGLWTAILPSDWVARGTEPVTADDIFQRLEWNSRELAFRQNEQEAEAALRRSASGYLLVDGVPHWPTGEPRFLIGVYGLGHNHGGTSLHVTYRYNDNIGWRRYFNANQLEEALAEAKRVAAARGDTEDVTRFEAGHYPTIEVLIPEAVTCDPPKEHGDGNPFLNRIEAVTESAPDAVIAGFGVLACLHEEISKPK